jgi:uncharacterized delta-60 repeat protein
MKPNMKHLPLFFFRSTPALVLILALTVASIQCAKADSISLDPNFNAPFFATPDTPGRALLLPGGKYVVFFNVDSLADQSTGSLIRFNADGTLDTTFSFSRDYGGVSAVAPTAGGQLIIAAGKTIYGVTNPTGHVVTEILRVNNNGTIDPTFGPAVATDGGEVRVIKANANGTILVGGRFTAFNGVVTDGIVRLLANGAVDPNFAPVTMTCPANPFGGLGNCGLWADPVVDANGKIIIAGDFISVNGVSAPCVARLNSNGTLDTTFNASGFQPNQFPNSPRPIRAIGIQSDNKIVIGGRFNGGSCGNHVPLVRLNTDGTRDQSYGYFGCLPPNGLFILRNLVIQPDDKVIGVGLSVWRFNSDGSLDSGFHNPEFQIAQLSCADTGNCPEAFNIGFEADGSLFVGGSFTDVDGVGPLESRWAAAKFNGTDGSLDTSFTTSRKIGNKIEPLSFARRADGSTFIAFGHLGPNLAASGGFAFPAIPHGLGRLASTGSLDTSFDPIAGFDPNGPLGPSFISLGFTPLTDGSLLLTGQGGRSANYGHLLANGAEDSNYQADPTVTFATALPRSDGKVVISTYNLALALTFADPIAQSVANGTEVQRINGDGTVDSSFHLDPSIVTDTQQRDGSGNLTTVYIGSGVLASTADNKIVFGYLSTDGSYHLVRLNDDGSIDSSFNTFPVTLSFYSTWIKDPQNPGGDYIPIQVYYPTDIPVKQGKPVLDGKVVLMGSFASYGGTPAHGLLRINSDGSADPTFNIGGGAQWTQTQEVGTFHPSIDNLEVGLDDKLLLTGTFEAFNGTAAPGIISLNPDGTVDTSFVAPVKRQKFDYQPAYLARQNDGSFLLSGPYSRAIDNISPSFFRLILPPGAPTPTGTNVSVDEGGAGAASDVTTSFGNVTSTGTTSVSVIDPNWAGQLPSGYQVVGANLAFEVYTTSSYTGPITVCFTLSSLDDATFAIARLFHNDGNGLVDVTSSKDPSTKTICGTVSSLSPFVILKPPYQATIQQPINANGTSVFSVRRGVVPVKFTLTLNGVGTCQLPSATIAVTRTAGGTIGTVNESVYSGSADNGSNFRVNSCQYVYNLNASALGVGTYRVDILINGQAVGGATFQLK